MKIPGILGLYTNTKRKLWLDLIRVFASIGVVDVHATSILFTNYKTISQFEFWIANIHNSVTRVCSPLFFMISGYLLLGKSERIIFFFKKRFHKIALPLVLWSIIYTLWKIYYRNMPVTIYDAILGPFETPVYTHLWFLYALIGLYLLTPALRVFVQNASSKTILYFILLWFGVTGIKPFIYENFNFDVRLNVNMATGYIGYFILGHFLGNLKLNRKILFSSLISYLLCLLVTVLGTYYTCFKSTVFNEYIFFRLSPNVIIMSCCVFIFGRYIGQKRILMDNKFSQNLFYELSLTSYGVYLVHPIIQHLVSDGLLGFPLNAMYGMAIFSIPFTTGVIYLLSFLLIRTIRKIPGLRLVSP